MKCKVVLRSVMVGSAREWPVSSGEVMIDYSAHRDSDISSLIYGS